MNDIYRSQFRLPYSLYEQLKASADKNRRSVNAELVARLEESFSPTQAILAIDECHRTSPSSVDNALEMIDRLRNELLAIAARPEE